LAVLTLPFFLSREHNEYVPSIFHGRVLSLIDLHDFHEVYIKSAIFSNFFNFSGFVTGLVHVSNTNEFLMVDCKFVKVKSRIGAAAFLRDINDIEVTGSMFYNNSASNLGGGLAIDSSEKVKIFHNFFDGNSAKTYGGAISINIVKSLVNITANKFVKNNAVAGLALIFARCDENVYISSNTFRANYGSVGTIFWLRSTMPLAPSILSSNSFDLNLVVYYGPEYATECVAFITENDRYSQTLTSYVPTDKGYYFEPVNLNFVDYYKQIVTFESGTKIFLYFQNNGLIECGGNTPTQYGIETAKSSRGSIKFTDAFGIRCWPGGVANGTFGAVISLAFSSFPTYDSGKSLILKPNSTSDVFDKFDKRLLKDKGWFEAKQQFNFKFRHCNVGEKWDSDTPTRHSCTVCYDSYSLLPNLDNIITSCNPCPKGALKCYSNQIILKPNTWRLSDDVVDIFDCPRFGACRGGNYSGNAACAIGYEGVLCGTCSLGYSFNGVACIFCGGENNKKAEDSLKRNIGIASGVVSFILLLIFIRLRRSSRYQRALFLSKFGIYTAVQVEKIFEESPLEEQQKILNDRKKKKNSIMGKFKIFVSTLQIISSASSNLKIEFPDILSELMKVLKIADFNLSEVFDTGCLVSFSYTKTILFFTLFPFIILVVIMISFLVYFLFYDTWKYDISGKPISDALNYFKRVFGIFCFIVYLALPTITNQLVKVFYCQKFGTFTYLLADLSLDCDSVEYDRLKKFIIAMIIVFPLGFSLVFFSILFQNRFSISKRVHIQNILAAPDVRTSKSLKYVKQKANGDAQNEATKLFTLTAFLYVAYKPEYWYWECIELVRRLTFAALLFIMITSEYAQATACLLLSFICAMVYSNCKPYQERSENILSELGLWQIFATYYLAYATKFNGFGRENYFYNVVGLLIFSFNFVIVFSNIYLGYKDFKAAEAIVETDVNHTLVVETIQKTLHLTSDIDLNHFRSTLHSSTSSDLLAFSALIFDRLATSYLAAGPAVEKPKYYTAAILNQDKTGSNKKRYVFHISPPGMAAYKQAMAGESAWKNQVQIRGPMNDVYYIEMPYQCLNLFNFIGFYKGTSDPFMTYCDMVGIEEYVFGDPVISSSSEDSFDKFHTVKREKRKEQREEFAKTEYFEFSSSDAASHISSLESFSSGDSTISVDYQKVEAIKFDLEYSLLKNNKKQKMFELSSSDGTSTISSESDNSDAEFIVDIETGEIIPKKNLRKGLKEQIYGDEEAEFMKDKDMLELSSSDYSAGDDVLANEDPGESDDFDNHAVVTSMVSRRVTSHPSQKSSFSRPGENKKSSIPASRQGDDDGGPTDLYLRESENSPSRYDSYNASSHDSGVGLVGDTARSPATRLKIKAAASISISTKGVKVDSFFNFDEDDGDGYDFGNTSTINMELSSSSDDSDFLHDDELN
jgi:hypothetical protein